MRSSLRFYVLIILLVSFCLMTTLVTAQDHQPAPQFLYRDGNHLVLLNGYTGEATELPLEITDRDWFSWSPDGKYLLARLKDRENDGYCLNLYDVDKLEWAYDEPISCAVREAVLTENSTRIFYSTSDGNNGALWVFAFEEEASRELYRTTEGEDFQSDGISNLQWSPTRTYLTFESYHSLIGGGLTAFVVMNIKNEKYMILRAPNTYYASYYPVWSANDSWFLIRLSEEYVYSGASPLTNHQGDVYLVNSETGAEYRLTYTPAVYEMPTWTEDGNIALTEITEQTSTLTLEQAMNVEVVPPDKIITPEPVDIEADYYFRVNFMISPDPKLGAWVRQQANYQYELSIGVNPYRDANFSVPIPASYQYSNILIGWRPSDYPYPPK